MNQYDLTINDFDRILRKRYKIILLIIATTLGFSIFFARMKPPVYSSTAAVRVDRTSVMGLGMESVMYGTWDNIETQGKVISSYPVLFRTAKSLEMIADTMQDSIAFLQEPVIAALNGIAEKLSVSTDVTANLIKITVTDGKPERARDIANAVVRAYKGYSYDMKKLQAHKTRTFIQDQLGRCAKDLAGIQQNIKAFKMSRRIPDVREDVQRIIRTSAELDNELDNLRVSIAEMEKQKRMFEKYLERTEVHVDTGLVGAAALIQDRGGAEWITDYTDKNAIRRLNDRLVQLQMQISDQRVYYRENHPVNVDVYKRIRETVEKIIIEYSKNLTDLYAKRDTFTKEKMENDTELDRIPETELEYSQLVLHEEVTRTQYLMLTKKLEEARIAEAGVVDDVTIAAIATASGSPLNKGTTKAVFFGLLIGIVLGAIFAIIREMLDTSIGTIEEVERTLNIPVLAAIPYIEIHEGQGKSKDNGSGDQFEGTRRLIVQFDPKKPSAEAFRILRTNLEYLSYENSFRVLLVSSATMGEGKSTLSSNLAIAFAQQGKRVVLLDCDLRRPSLHKIFGLRPDPGLADVLIGKAHWKDCVRNVTDLALGRFSLENIVQVPGLENFNIVAFGHKPHNPAELLDSPMMDELITALRGEYDIVVIDSPAVLPVADSMVLVKHSDAVVLIYKMGLIGRSSLFRAKERMESGKARVLGIVLNGIRPETMGIISRSAYHYHYYYYDEKGKKKPRKRISAAAGKTAART